MKRLFAQVLIHAALNDAEKRVRVPEAVEFVLAALRPAKRHAHRIRRLLLSRGLAVDFVRRTFVKLHHDVGIQHSLDPHRLFRRQEKTPAVDRGGELHALLGDLPDTAKREDLESARIGQDRTIPVHEVMQPLMEPNHFKPRTEPEVEGVAQNDLGTVVLQLLRRHRLHGAAGADRHEDRRLHDAVIQVQFTAAGFDRRFQNFKR